MDAFKRAIAAIFMAAMMSAAPLVAGLFYSDALAQELNSAEINALLLNRVTEIEGGCTTPTWKNPGTLSDGKISFEKGGKAKLLQGMCGWNAGIVAISSGEFSWTTNNNSLCLSGANRLDQSIDRLDNCYSVTPEKWSFILRPKGDEGAKYELIISSADLPKGPHNQLVEIRKTIAASEKENAEKQARVAAEAERKSAEKLAQQKEEEKTRRADEAEAKVLEAKNKKRRQAEDRDRDPARQEAEKKRKAEENSRRLAEAQKLEKELQARNQVMANVTNIMKTLNACMPKTPSTNVSIEADISYLDGRIKCLDSAISEFDTIRSDFQSVNAEVFEEKNALLMRRESTLKAMRGKVSEVQKLKEQAAKRIAIARHKHEEAQQRQELATSSKLFDGDDEDFVFLINLSSPGVTLGLSGKPVFLQDTVPSCSIMPLQRSELKEAFPKEALSAVEIKAGKKIDVKHCESVASETTELIVFRRKMIGFASLDRLKALRDNFRDGVFVEYYSHTMRDDLARKQAEREAIEKAAEQKRLDIESVRNGVINGSRSGFGFIVVDETNEAVCIENSNGSSAIESVIEGGVHGTLDHLVGKNIKFLSENLEATFLSLKLKKCGTVFASAKSLGILHKALTRDKINTNFSHVWITNEQFEDSAKKAQEEASIVRKEEEKKAKELKELASKKELIKTTMCVHFSKMETILSDTPKSADGLLASVKAKSRLTTIVNSESFEKARAYLIANELEIYSDKDFKAALEKSLKESPFTKMMDAYEKDERKKFLESLDAMLRMCEKAFGIPSPKKSSLPFYEKTKKQTQKQTQKQQKQIGRIVLFCVAGPVGSSKFDMMSDLLLQGDNINDPYTGYSQALKSIGDCSSAWSRNRQMDVSSATYERQIYRGPFAGKTLYKVENDSGNWGVIAE